MKQKLNCREYAYIASMLFRIVFRSRQPDISRTHGSDGGQKRRLAIIGLCVTGVGLPLLGVAALGISRANGLFELGSRVGRPYSLFFTCLLYLTIGPFFAIPRCATTSFTVGLEQVLPQNGSAQMYLLLFSFLFFGAALFFALRPGKILVWVGKVLNPCFLAFLGVWSLLPWSIPVPRSAVSRRRAPMPPSRSLPASSEGYNTMDALASLAFGIVVVQVIRGLGVNEAGCRGGQHRPCRYFQLPADGCHLRPRDHRRRAEPRTVRDLGKRRHRPRRRSRSTTSARRDLSSLP